MWSAAVLAVVPEGLAVRAVVVVPLLVGVCVAVVELTTADVTIGDQGVTGTTALSEGDRDRSPVSRGTVDRRRPAVVTPDLSVTEVRASLRVDHDNSSWSRAEKGYSPRSGVSPAWWLQARRQPLHVQKLIYIYINYSRACQQTCLQTVYNTL